jgi:hypothetical protein
MSPKEPVSKLMCNTIAMLVFFVGTYFELVDYASRFTNFKCVKTLAM